MFNDLRYLCISNVSLYDSLYSPPPPLSASPSKAFSPHIPHSIVILSSSDSSPPPYLLIFSLVTFPSCQLPSPPVFPSSAAAHLLYFSSRHFFIVSACKASPRTSFVSPFRCIDTRFRLFCPFPNSLSLLLKPYRLHFILPAGRSCLLPPRLLLRLIPHIPLSLQCAASSLPLLL